MLSRGIQNMSENVYDCIIVGAGPAGLAAALYTSRDRMSTLVLDKFYPGGQIITTDRIENYPGYENISGPDLTEKMVAQVNSFGAEIKMSTEVKSIEKLDDGTLKVTCPKEQSYIARTVILSPGSSYRKLGVPGEDKFRNAGAGVSYCGTCDAAFFKDKKVISVGGGNTAVEDALHLAKYASEVVIVHRRDEFRATPILVEELMEKVNADSSNIRLTLNSVVTKIGGEGKVQFATIKNVKTDAEHDEPCDGVFIFIGMTPNTEFLKGFVDLTDEGFIKCDSAYLRTKVPGVFVAGDCRSGANMQLVTAVGDGVNCAMMLKHYLRDPKWWNSKPTDTLTPGEW
jgi:thioredoxin reductase (NADPH)